MESGPPSPERPDRADAGAGSPPEPPAGPQAPPPGYAPPPGPEAAPGYGGAVSPGGWRQPVARAAGDAAWVGRPLASWGSRVAAAVIDGLIIGIPAVVLFVAFLGSAVGLTGDDSDASAWAVIGGLLLWFVLVAAFALLYAPATMARRGAHNGQTWGKQLLGIRVLRDNGKAMSFGWAALREVVIKGLAVGIASSIVPVVPYVVDVLWPLWDDENRALHDMAVQTHVVAN
jgi:uncharacterized RDD family membrane protein YckC